VSQEVKDNIITVTEFGDKVIVGEDCVYLQAVQLTSAISKISSKL